MNRICAAAILAIATLLLSACFDKTEAKIEAPAAVDVASCFDARVFAYAPIHQWEIHATNTCNKAFDHAYFLVKYLNLFGDRIGVDAVVANYVAPRERISHTYDVPKNLQASIYSVQIRKVSTDPLDLRK